MTLKVRDALIPTRNGQNIHADPEAYPLGATVALSVNRTAGDGHITVELQAQSARARNVFRPKQSNWTTVLEGVYYDGSDVAGFSGQVTVTKDMVLRENGAKLRVVLTRRADIGLNDRYDLLLASDVA